MTQPGQNLARDDLLQQGAHAQHDGTGMPGVQGSEGGQTSRLDFRMRGEGVVGADFPVREGEDLLRPAMVKGKIGGELFRLPVVGGKDQQRFPALGEKPGKQAGRGRADQTKDLAVRRAGNSGYKGAHSGMGDFSC